MSIEFIILELNVVILLFIIYLFIIIINREGEDLKLLQ